MNRFALVCALAASALVIGGCKKDKAAPSAATPPTEEIVPQAQPYVPTTPPSYTEVTPAPAAAVDTAPVAPVKAAPGGAITGTTYTVQKGDTLYSIAQRRYGSGAQYKKILSANPGLKAERLLPGTKIKLP